MGALKIECLVSAAETDGKVSVFREAVPPGVGPPLHIHQKQHEVFHLIEGKIEFQLEGAKVVLSAGESITIPPGVRHSFINREEKPALIHFDLLPSGNAEAFFDKLVHEKYSDVGQLFAEHGLTLCGPPLK